jgi:oligoribonuclease NrnB/cAMP/cGMP phosphodiesterase (DHH superfamily)
MAPSVNKPTSETANILVLYHADCLDGLGAAWAAYRAFTGRASYIPVRYGDPFPDFDEGATIYILDFSFDPEVLVRAAERAAQIFLLDHHKSALDRFEAQARIRSLPENVHVEFDMNRSGCVLAWNLFNGSAARPPKILLHIQDRDLWRFAMPGTREITTALYSLMPIPLPDLGAQDLPHLFQIGKVQADQFDGMVKRLAKASHPVVLAGCQGVAVNAPAFFSSDLGDALARKSGTFGMTYQFSGEKGMWVCSLRSRGEIDVAAIAEKFGGGGHSAAAGFILGHDDFMRVMAGSKGSRPA